ncbi:MAG: phage tail protein [Flavobacteriaceae bacterium]|nr:phage tail protein [Flavobacteriaceae bacterium]|tara:strand:- start:80 stop:550 length:471 start_codon:yes stop_codon:yes gene_type:complete
MALPTAGTGGEQDQFWPLPKYYFSVDIGSFTDLPFMEVNGLDIGTDLIEYRHGNSPSHTPIKMPGLGTASDVTLKKGVFLDDNQFYDWISQINLNTFERFDVVVRLLDETGSPRITWNLNNCFPLKITPAEMNSQESGTAIETLVLAHELETLSSD